MNQAWVSSKTNLWSLSHFYNYICRFYSLAAVHIILFKIKGLSRNHSLCACGVFSLLCTCLCCKKRFLQGYFYWPFIVPIGNLRLKKSSLERSTGRIVIDSGTGFLLLLGILKRHHVKFRTEWTRQFLWLVIKWGLRFLFPLILSFLLIGGSLFTTSLPCVSAGGKRRRWLIPAKKWIHFDPFPIRSREICSRGWPSWFWVVSAPATGTQEPTQEPEGGQQATAVRW